MEKRGWKVSRFSYGRGRGRAFVHRISKYANLENWKLERISCRIDGDSAEKKGRFVFRNTRILKIGKIFLTSQG